MPVKARMTKAQSLIHLNPRPVIQFNLRAMGAESRCQEDAMRRALFWSIIAVASISTGVAAADDNLKGAYSFVGTQVCLTASEGFKADSKGSLTIPQGNTTISVVSSEGQITYNGDGTGKGTGTFVTIVPPPNPFGASISAGTVSYSFTNTPISNHESRVTFTPGTYQGTLEAGPAAGQQFAIDVGSRVLRISSDRKRITSAAATPHVEKITFSGSPQNPVARICSWTGSQSLLD